MTRYQAPQPQRYIWQLSQWPELRVDTAAVTLPSEQARMEQGRLSGLLDAIGFEQTQGLHTDVWVQEALATAAIEGERLDVHSVRSSVARRLGVQSDADAPAQKILSIEGLVDVQHDAITRHHLALTHDRLQRWQAALFAGLTVHGFAGVTRIAVGCYRSHSDAMQIVSGLPGRERVHYQAPASSRVQHEMTHFLAWFNAPALMSPDRQHGMNGLVRAAIAHLWFETIHPFEDGNGRLGRAIMDMALAQDMGPLARMIGVSQQMLRTRKTYYDALNTAQCGSLDVTPWVTWFIDAFTQACVHSQGVVRQAIARHHFWQNASSHPINPRQRKTLQRLLDAGDGGFLGGMSVDKHRKLNPCSKPTATRDLSQLVQWGLLAVNGTGKATRYGVTVPGWKALTI